MYDYRHFVMKHLYQCFSAVDPALLPLATDSLSVLGLISRPQFCIKVSDMQLPVAPASIENAHWTLMFLDATSSVWTPWTLISCCFCSVYKWHGRSRRQSHACMQFSSLKLSLPGDELKSSLATYAVYIEVRLVSVLC